MTHDREKDTVALAHETYFGAPADAMASAPGRVNLLGEHTDYNGGYVLPIALKDLGVSVALGRGPVPGAVMIQSLTLGSEVTRMIDEPGSGHWSDYILGCAAELATQPVADQGLRISVSTTLPMGAGLSSSAALEVATLRALAALFEIAMSPVEIAQTARRVENEFVGVPCGIMDQFASSVGKPGEALFLDTRHMIHEKAPGLADHAFVIVDSGVSHSLSDGGYATRVAECKAARQALGVDCLSDLGIGDLDRIDALSAPLGLRARHIITDNALVLQGLEALKSGDAETFGHCMIQSHRSARDNYQITVPETDALAEAAVAHGALGARQTGGGWGGAVVALVARDRIAPWWTAVSKDCPGTRRLAVT